MIREYVRRLLVLLGGLAVSAVGITMMLQANIGLEPWSVLQQGMAQTFGMTYGTAGIGTLGNILICGPLIDLLLYLGRIPAMERLWSGVLMLLGGLELLALGTWLYMKSALGAGPRDALMVVLARRTGRSVGVCRAVVELVIILAGWRMGGQVGAGTVIAALGLGSLFNLNFALLRFPAAEIHQENLAETLRRLRGGAAETASEEPRP